MPCQQSSLRVTLLGEGDGRKASLTASPLPLRDCSAHWQSANFSDGPVCRVAERRYLLGDASARGYETIATGGEHPLILMNSPYNPGGPVLRDGKTYMQIAHLSQSVTAFVAIDRLLQSKGFRVPEIHAEDLESGFLLLENLGSEGVLDASGAPNSGTL